MTDFSDIHEGCLIAIFTRYDGRYTLGIVTSCSEKDDWEKWKKCQVILNDEYRKSRNPGDFLPYFLESKEDYEVLFTAEEINQKIKKHEYSI